MRFLHHILRNWRWPIYVMVSLYISAVVVKALSSAFNHNRFPELLLIKVETWPIIFPLHMISGGLALVLVPLAFALRGARWHKLAGRIAALDIVIAAVTAIPVALENPLTSFAAAGFAMQAVVWMTFLSSGIWNIRRGRMNAHQNAMLMMAAVTSGTLFFRLFLAGFAAFGNQSYFKIFYSINAWISWCVPLILGLVWLIHSRRVAKRGYVEPVI